MVAETLFRGFANHHHYKGSVPTSFLWAEIHRRMVVELSRRFIFSAQRNMEYYYKREVRTIVQQLARELNQPPVNASIHKETGQVIPHQNGFIWILMVL